ncbi:efflux transporter outer membrane subunit [uncultured Sphingomonas sp.]|uniref:efflux transporter outer membrane subunit n=1 Tax=uncultured Sphingomonas sp. TaxID=158754 RepID=UPI0035CA6EA6
MTLTNRLATLASTLALAGCSLAPAYHRPNVGAGGATPPTWKTAPGWAIATPLDDAPRADWWTAFADPALNDLVGRAVAHNQTLAQAAATYRQARAATREARANLFPTIGVNGDVTHTYSGGNTAVATGGTVSGGTTTGTGTGGTGTTGTGTTGTGTTTGTVTSGGRATTNYRVNLTAAWTPDFFGALTNTARNARLTEQARLADLANARLALQGELATDYLSLRGVDAQIASLTATVQAYQRSLTIATNRYNAGVVARTDQFQAQSQLASAQSNLVGEQRTRAQFEDAIAVLVGENPAGFTIPSLGTTWSAAVPAVPLVVPATLTQRRPDIASAERAVAAANAQIGVQRAAFFPTVNLTGEAGFSNDSLSGLFSSAASLWSLGASVAETLLDFGARKARVAQARAAYDAAVANYRQVTLTAFQEVQDDLIAVQVLARQEQLLRTASVAADQSEATLRNQYRAGLVVFTDVVTSQATALAARRALLQAEQDRQTASVALVQALGGGWSDADLTSGAEVARAAAVADSNR